MNLIYRFVILFLIFFISQIYPQDINECLNSDYRYLLQRAWDESNNLQFIKKSDEYLDEFSKTHSNCSEIIKNERYQNNLKKDALRYINTNTYPFSFAFSNTMRNQKYFIEGIQVAIEDGANELKTILDKIIIKDGQIPILIIIDFEDSTIPIEEINKKRELYFAHIFKHIEGIYHYSPYNRTEHNEILGDIPIGNEVLREENILKIYKKTMETDKWDRLFIIRLTVKKILKDSNIFSLSRYPEFYKSQTFVTFDLFKITESKENKQNVYTQLIASADITGIRSDTYYYHSDNVLIIGSIIFLFIILIITIDNHYKIREFFTQNKEEKKTKSNKFNYKKEGGDLINKYILSLLFLSGFLFLFTTFFFPYNHLFENVIGEWLDVSSKSSQVILILIHFAVIVAYLFLSYILTNKFIEPSFLLKEKYGLPFLYGISAYAINLSIVYKISVYNFLYQVFEFSKADNFDLFNLSINSIFFIASFVIIGLNIQKILQLISIRKKLLFINEKFKDSQFEYEKEFYNKSKDNISNINFLLCYSSLSLLLLLIYIDLFLLKTMKSDYSKILVIWKSIYLFPPFILSVVLGIVVWIKNRNLNLDYEDIFVNKRIEALDSYNYTSFFSSEKDEYRFNFDQIYDLDKELKEFLNNVKKNNNLIFITGRDKSGKKEIVEKITKEIIEKSDKKKIININFSEKIDQENEITKFLQIGKLKIPEIAVLHDSRSVGKILNENSKNPILNFIKEIPFIGTFVYTIISSERFVDQTEVKEMFLKDITKIYINYINSYITENNSNQKIILILENIHKCNESSYDILLKILDGLYNKKEKEFNKNLVIILTGDTKKYYKNIMKIDLIELAKEFNSSMKITFKENSKYRFLFFKSNGYELDKFKDIMWNKYSFARTILNEYFIEKLFYTLKTRDVIYLNDVNLTLRFLFENKRLIFDKNINKIILNEIIESIMLPPEFTTKIKADINLLNESEKHLVLATTQLHDWFTLEQISFTIGLSETKLEAIIFSINEKIPELYVFKDNNYLRINKKIREYFKTEILPNYPKESIDGLKLKLFSKNFIKNYSPQINENINDLKKLSYFSFYMDDPNETLKLNSYYIREAYFNNSDRIKVFSVLKIIDEKIIRNCNTNMQAEFIYLVAIHYSFKKIFSKQSLFKNLYSILKKNDRINDSYSIKYLSFVIINYNFKEQLDFIKKENYFDSKLSKVKENLLFNFENLLKSAMTEDRLIVKGWILFLTSYFTKNFIKSTDKFYKDIYENLVKIIKKYLPISNEIESILESKFENGAYLEFQPIHDYCMNEINDILLKHKNTDYDPNEKYLLTDMSILTKELEHLKTRIQNISLELYVRDLNEYKNIQNDVVLNDKIERIFKDSIKFSKKLNNISGIAITESLFSHFYLYNNQFIEALKHNKASYDNNVSIKDYKGIEKSLKYRINILEEAKTNSDSIELNKDLEKSKQELKLFNEHNPDLWNDRSQMKSNKQN
jgi:hypothetical protein